jgi:MFS family permease
MRKRTLLLIRGILTVAGGILLSTSSALGNCFGILAPYLVSYMRQYDSRAKNNAAGIMPVLASMTIVPALMLSSLLAKKIGYRPSLFIGAIGLSSCYFSISFVRSWILGVFIMGTCSGFFLGFLLVLQVYPAMTYFPKYKGVLAGAILAGGSLSPFCIGSIFMRLINPDGVGPNIIIQNGNNQEKYFSGEIIDEMPHNMRVFASVMFAMMTFSIIFIQEPLTKDSLRNMNSNSVFSILNSLPNQNEKNLSRSVIISLKKNVFSWHAIYLLVSLALGMQFIAYVQYNFKVFGYSVYDFGGMENTLSNIGMIGFVGGIIGKIFQGLLYDRFGPRFAFICAFAGSALLSILYYPLSKFSIVGYFAVTVLTIFMFGMLFGNLPLICNYYYGLKKGPTMYGFFYISVFLGTLLMDVLVSRIMPLLGDWATHTLLGICPAIALVIFSFFRPEIESAKKSTHVQSIRQTKNKIFMEEE